MHPPNEGDRLRMLNDRTLQETIARCVSIMVYFRSSSRTPKARSFVLAEVQSIAAWVAGSDLTMDEIQGDLLEPLRVELVARYGGTIGNRLTAIFAEAFAPCDELLPERRSPMGS